MHTPPLQVEESHFHRDILIVPLQTVTRIHIGSAASSSPLLTMHGNYKFPTHSISV